MTTDQESWEDLNEALVCGLLVRFGPNDAQLAELPWWRRAACRLLPRRHRWRLHSLAPRIRQFDALTGPPAS